MHGEGKEEESIELLRDLERKDEMTKIERIMDNKLEAGDCGDSGLVVIGIPECAKAIEQYVIKARIEELELLKINPEEDAIGLVDKIAEIINKEPLPKEGKKWEYSKRIAKEIMDNLNKKDTNDYTLESRNVQRL